MSITTLLQTVSQAIQNLAADSHRTDAMIAAAQAHVRRHVSSLQSGGQNYQHVALDSVRLLAEHIKLGAEAQAIAQHCTWSAMSNLVHDNHHSQKQPSEYAVTMYQDVMAYLEDEQQRAGFDINFYLIFVLAFLIMTVLLGPFWPVLVPLRIMGFGALGVRTGFLASWLQRVLFRGALSFVSGALASFFCPANVTRGD